MFDYTPLDRVYTKFCKCGRGIWKTMNDECYKCRGYVQKKLTRKDVPRNNTLFGRLESAGYAVYSKSTGWFIDTLGIKTRLHGDV